MAHGRSEPEPRDLGLLRRPHRAVHRPERFHFFVVACVAEAVERRRSVGPELRAVVQHPRRHRAPPRQIRRGGRCRRRPDSRGSHARRGVHELRLRSAVVQTRRDDRRRGVFTDADARIGFRQSPCKQRRRARRVEGGGLRREQLHQRAVRSRNRSGLRRRARRHLSRRQIGAVLARDRIHGVVHGDLRDRHAAGLWQRPLTGGDGRVQRDLVPLHDRVADRHRARHGRTAHDQRNGCQPGPAMPQNVPFRTVSKLLRHMNLHGGGA